ncbi:MAG: DUF1801 domain-containing protein [Proteobacteria bacterium]|nr:DUF1801 domain-containing protein [Pseudomonadota bacterium]
MERLFTLPDARAHDPAVAAWLGADDGPVRALAAHWFGRLKALGPDVAEVMHDHCPTACIAGAAFAYVGAYRAHAAIGFFAGSELPDPGGLLEGKGQYMRHVKLRPGALPDEAAVHALIAAAYADLKAVLG